jgi:hypothetical protein
MREAKYVWRNIEALLCNHCCSGKAITIIFYVYGSVHHNIFYEITNRCSYMQSILFHC